MSATAQLFEQAFGQPPEGVWAAPGRVNLIGEHTDYNDGFVLPIALPQRAEVAVRRRSDRLLRVRSNQQQHDPHDLSLDTLQPGAVDGWAAYPAGVVWALEEAGNPLPGVDLLIDSSVPVGAGLSSSAAVACALALALVDLLQLDLDRGELARLAQRAENEFVGVPCGIMDQSAALLCRAGHALLLDTRSQQVDHVPLELDSDGLTLLVVDTRTRHALADGAYAERRETCHRSAAELGLPSLRDVHADLNLDRLSDTARRRVRHVVTENSRVERAVELLRQGRTRETGPLLTESHRSLRDDYEVSCLELDTAVDAALEAGAHGARMTGGGFGGCVIALTDITDRHPVGAAVTAAFAQRSLSPPAVFSVRPEAGAARLVEVAR